MKSLIDIKVILEEIIEETEVETGGEEDYRLPTDREQLNKIYHLCKDALSSYSDKD